MKKKSFIATGVVTLLGAGIIGATKAPSNNQISPPTVPTASHVISPTETPATQASTDTSQPTNSQTSDDNLSNNNSYVNTDGDTVHSPAYSEDSSIPVGATAKCTDGTFSFSENHRGTCSHHGGVAEWL